MSPLGFRLQRAHGTAEGASPGFGLRQLACNLPVRGWSAGRHGPRGPSLKRSEIMAMQSPPHPGSIVKHQCLEPLGLTVTRAARGLGVTRQTLSELVNERTGISAELAIRLSKAFGSTPETLAGDADGLRPLAGPQPHQGDRSGTLCGGVIYSTRLSDLRAGSVGPEASAAHSAAPAASVFVP